ncbi:hypothetical protein jhhlp_001833 [Lomentospora prolificans]|uniref:Calcineurin-like phosphoesterase domain-containing protein n=1 Tax=Lomentospora prolificans TaxID=41688 RepID=A0A2N3NH10_9PEZI|nr:hypothetical protein jhhlp_001833 [Lomentospora prolificans]
MDAAASKCSETRPETRTMRRTRFICISDTHNANVALPKGDVLIHAGDLTNRGSYSELSKTIQWLEKADFECKIVIAGNHELTLDEPYYADLRATSSRPNYTDDPSKCLSLLTSSSLTYLSHASTKIQLSSPSGPRTTFTVFGSPHTPRRGQETAFSAFVYDTPNKPSDPSPTLWNDIPSDADIVVTHTPPRGHLDMVPGDIHIGCVALRKALWRVRPRLAVCGHVHFGRGADYVSWGPEEGEVASTETWVDPAPEGKKNSLVDLTARRGALGQRGNGHEGSCVVNASIQTGSYTLDPHHRGYRKMNKPIVVDLDLPTWE